MKTDWVDFKTIKTSVRFEQIFEHYKIDWLQKTDDELHGRCPIHNGDGKNTFHANLTKKVFHCFSCKAQGNVLDFVAAMEKCGAKTAAQKLQQWFAVTTPSPTAKSDSVTTTMEAPKRGEQLVKNEPLKFQLRDIDPAHPYIASRGIALETAQNFGVGFFPGKGTMSGRVVIPIHGEHGQLLAYAGRSIDDLEPRYKLPVGFKKSHEVYNLHRAIETGAATVVVVEGYFGCMKVTQAGYVCVSLIGSELSEIQAKLLRKHFTAFILMFDPDAAGRDCTDQCLTTLGKDAWVKAITLQKQPDQMTDDEIIAALS
jgi:DNA primase